MRLLLKDRWMLAWLILQVLICVSLVTIDCHASDISWSDKITGGTVSADDMNDIKTAVNSKPDSAAEVITLFNSGTCSGLPYSDGSCIPLTANVITFLGASDYAAMRTQLGIGATTSTERSGNVISNNIVTTFAPTDEATAPTTNVFSVWGEVSMTGAEDWPWSSGNGHGVGLLGHFSHDGTGTVGLGIGSEGTISVTNAGGTITSAAMFYGNLLDGTGAIDSLYGVFIPDIDSTNVTNFYSFMSIDPLGVFYNAGYMQGVSGYVVGGVFSTDYLIDDASNGAASATLYIGNESIITSGDVGTAAARAAEDTLTNGANLPDGGAITAYIAGLGYLTTESDPNALLTAGTDNVNDTHINWGSGANQVDSTDIGAEPALGNPGTTGYVLSSTDAGVRSWIAPGAGSFAVTDITGQTDDTTPATTATAVLAQGGSLIESTIQQMVDAALAAPGAIGGTTPGAGTFTTGNIDLLDGVGAVDMDYGSGDITDHTFASDGGTVILDGSVAASAGVDLGTSQALVGTTAMTIGNNGQTVAINSSGWDIDASGNMTGVGTVSAGDGGFTVDADGDTTVKSITVTASASPGFTANDSDSPGADKTAGFIGWQYVGGADGAENSDFLLQTMQAGSLATVLAFDESDDQFETTKVINSSGGFTGNLTGNASGSAGSVAVGNITGAGAGVLAWAATPSSANLATAVTGETGSGALVFGTSPGFTTAANPVSSDGATLGTAALEWSDLFIADGGVIYGQDDQSATLTSSASLWTANNFTITTGLTIPYTSSGDQALVVGRLGLKADEDLIVTHGGAAGEVQDEAGISLIQHISITFDPAYAYDQNGNHILPLFSTGDDMPHGITITEWGFTYVTGDPTTEFAGDLVNDSDWTAAGATVNDVMDTTAGAATADTGFDVATIANGRNVFITMDSDPTDASVQVLFELWFFANED